MSLEPCILAYFYFIAPHNVSPIQNHILVIGRKVVKNTLLYDIFIRITYTVVLIVGIKFANKNFLWIFDLKLSSLPLNYLDKRLFFIRKDSIINILDM